ncbi:MAG TPA: hypothetical protein VMV56_07850 [Williamwhitmania sp.]|nr:hypothetical protein [Williamwhitmania sp.]
MKKILPLLGMVAIISSSCMDNNNCTYCNSYPTPFVFTLFPSPTGTSMINDSTYIPDSIQLYYLKNNVQEPVNFTIGNSNYFGNYIYTTDISKVSAGDNIKTFYLHLSQTETDTIYFDCKIVNDGCCTYYNYDSLSYNGKVMPYSSIYGLYFFIKSQP